MVKTDLKTYQVLSYKHNGRIHRIWHSSELVKRTDDYIVLANNTTLIEESDGRVWQSRDPAVNIFLNDEWFNVICMLRQVEFIIIAILLHLILKRIIALCILIMT